MAQCDGQWLPGDGLPGTNGPVYAMTYWDPDGPGSLAPRLVLGGSFTVAGTVAAANIVMWDGENWFPFGSGVADPSGSPLVSSFATASNGDLIAAGLFATAGGVTVNHIARWDGTKWSALGEGAGSRCYAVVALPNGEIIAADGTPNRFISRWTGTQWVSLGSGMNGNIFTLAALPDGSFVAGGKFSAAGGHPIARLARWDGTDWVGIGDGFVPLQTSFTDSVLATATGEIFASGFLQIPGDSATSTIAHWDGMKWSSLGHRSSVPAVSPGHLALARNGDLLSADGYSVNRWNGTAWNDFGLLRKYDGESASVVTESPDGDLVVGGSLLLTNVLSLKGDTWKPLGRGIGGWTPTAGQPGINTLCPLPDGRVIAGGSFAYAGGESVNSIAIWDGRRWSPMGAGVHGTQITSIFGTSVNAIARLPNGDIVICGKFVYAGDQVARGVARWDGHGWRAMTTQNFFGQFSSISVLPNGHPVFGGQSIYEWDGASFIKIENVGLVMPLYALANGWGGTLVAGDLSRLKARYSDTWAPIPDQYNLFHIGIGPVSSLLFGRSGDLYAGANSLEWELNLIQPQPYASVARHDGLAWKPLPFKVSPYITSPAIRGMAEYGDGLAIVGGFSACYVFDGHLFPPTPLPANNIIRCDGAGCLPWSTGTNAPINAVAALPNGELVVGGSFTTTASDPGRPYFARWTDKPVPPVSLSPRPSTVNAGETLALHAAPTDGYSGVSYRWTRNGVDLFDGPGGASNGGGTVSGASGVLGSPTRNDLLTLTISGARPSDTGEYAVTFANTCGTSSASASEVVRGCPCDLDGNDLVDDGDFSVFTIAYDTLDCADPAMSPGCPADLNGDGFVDDADFQVFVGAYHGMVCS